MTPEWNDNSGRKGPQKVSCATSCPKQGHLWDHNKLFGALPSWVWKPPRTETLQLLCSGYVCPDGENFSPYVHLNLSCLNFGLLSLIHFALLLRTWPHLFNLFLSAPVGFCWVSWSHPSSKLHKPSCYSLLQGQCFSPHHLGDPLLDALLHTVASVEIVF